MVESNANTEGPSKEAWEEEITLGHRWGRHGEERAKEELAPLKKLREKCGPLSEDTNALIEQIRSLEICNWDMEDSILALCTAIGAKKPTSRPIGHLISVTDARWNRVWSYYFALRQWLPRDAPAGYESQLTVCDPDGTVQRHIQAMLGEPNELKALYVERFCRCLEFWLSGYPPVESAQTLARKAAIAALEGKIRELDPEGKILDAMEDEGDGRLQPCNHKAFRRYDMIISSIGGGKWRATMPRRGTDGFERAATVERFTIPIEAWCEGREKPPTYEDSELFSSIGNALGSRDNVRVFLASLLASLLRSQAMTARMWAEKRAKAAEQPQGSG